VDFGNLYRCAKSTYDQGDSRHVIALRLYPLHYYSSL